VIPTRNVPTAALAAFDLIPRPIGAAHQAAERLGCSRRRPAIVIGIPTSGTSNPIMSANSRGAATREYSAGTVGIAWQE
jgi:hypothetical protein